MTGTNVDVGIIGLGRIGWPIAENLLAAGWAVHGYRRSPMDELTASGGHACGSAAEVAGAAELVITCLPNEQAMTDTVDAIVTSLTTHTVIDMSTFGLGFKHEQAERLAAVGITLMDCPVLGLPPMVARRRAVVFASGPGPHYERIAPVLDAVT